MRDCSPRLLWTLGENCSRLIAINNYPKKKRPFNCLKLYTRLQAQQLPDEQLPTKWRDFLALFKNY